MHKVLLFIYSGLISLPIMGMQMGKQITPITKSGNAAIDETLTHDTAPSRHSACTKGCTCLLCCAPAFAIDILCYCPLCCRLSPIQKSNESDSDLMARADANHAVEAQHRAHMKALYSNDACGSLYRKIYLLSCDKSPHHTQRCEAEEEHLCCFTKALIKFVTQ